MNLYGSDWNMIKLAGAFLVLFGIAELLYHKMGVRAEYTRKIVHAGTGLLTLLFPLLLDEFWQAAALCGSFLLLLVISMRWKLLPSINAVERDTLGSVLYPIVVLMLFGINEYLFWQTIHAEGSAIRTYFFWTPILIMALCDPLAAAVGQRIAARTPSLRGRKTWQGSAAFFAGAMLLAFVFCRTTAAGDSLMPALTAARILTLAATTTLAERWSKRGWDNFTIPLTAVAVLWAFELIRA